MKEIYLIPLVLLLCACETTSRKQSEFSPDGTSTEPQVSVGDIATNKKNSMVNLVADYQLIDPRSYHMKLYDNAPPEDSDCYSNEYKDAKKMLDKKNCWLNYLPNSEDFVFIKQISGSVNADFLTSSVSVAGESYQIVSNWMRYFHSVPTDKKRRRGN